MTDAELRAQILGYGQISRTPIFRGCDWRVKQTDRSLTVIVREGIHYTGVRDLRRNSDKADEIYRQLTDKGCVPLKVLIATACWQRRAVEGMSVHLRKSDVVTTVQIQYRDLGSKDSQKLSALAQKVAQHVSKGM
ncbi:hypothetical protein [Spirillospora sp. NPDC047279]|uniref:hypothetical protein n=1 Tax=Spirillospora sp. NPDC047279 TaxID=3155478 RepID=UPI0033F39ABF